MATHWHSSCCCAFSCCCCGCGCCTCACGLPLNNKLYASISSTSIANGFHCHCTATAGSTVATALPLSRELGAAGCSCASPAVVSFMTASAACLSASCMWVCADANAAFDSGGCSIELSSRGIGTRRLCNHMRHTQLWRLACTRQAAAKVISDGNAGRLKNNHNLKYLLFYISFFKKN